MSEHILQLDSYVLKEDHRRDHQLLHTENYAQRIGEFDFNTLIYDIVITDSKTLLYCPKLFNFEKIITESNIYINNRPVRFKIKKKNRYDIIEIKETGEKLTITNSVFNKSWELKKFNYDRFLGKNCLSTLNKNNNLEWISDFVKFHIKHHGLDVIILYDNGSTDYTLNALEKCLRNTGISDFLIVNVPLPFGPILKNKDRSFLFLQEALLNLSRDKFFQLANAVLNIDIDELVWKQEKTIFELTQSSFFGFVLFRGEWRFVSPQVKKISHQAHQYIDPFEKSCPTKYCYAPKKIARWFQLGIHRLHLKRTLLRNLINYLLEDSRIGYWHCRGISTNWKYNRNIADTNLDVCKIFATYFS